MAVCKVSTLFGGYRALNWRLPGRGELMECCGGLRELNGMPRKLSRSYLDASRAPRFNENPQGKEDHERSSNASYGIIY